MKRALLVRRLLRVALLGAFAAVSACALQGPRLTPVSHLAYNEAVQLSERRELLLNLVRLRYNDSPAFLAISSIASQMQFDAVASLAGSFGDDGGTVRLAAPGAAAGYSESPTITFSPLRGEEFTRRLVAPVELDSLYLLTRYGWSLERTLRLVVDEVSGIRNAVPRETATAQDVESVERFAEFARVMQSLHERHLIELDVVERWSPLSSPIPAARVSAQDLLSVVASGHRFAYAADSESYSLQSRTQHYVLRVTPEAPGTRDLTEMLARLSLHPGRSTYEIDAPESSDAPPGTALTIRTRSVLGAMAHAAQSIEVLEKELERGSVAPRALPDSPYSPLLRVRSSDAEPAGAFVAVPYRGRWFYVDDGDLDSKRTLGVLSSLIRLEIGAGTTDGTRLFYKDWGVAQPILFSHGWPLSSDAWDQQMLFFGQKGFRVIAHDRRSHGRSDQTWDGNNMDQYADDLAELIEALHLRDLILVGHSTGGGEVCRYIGRHGTARVGKVVLVGAVPPLMLKTDANPHGTPRSAFDGIRENTAKNRSQFFYDLTVPFYGFNRDEVKSNEGVRENFRRIGLQGGIKGQYDCIHEFSEIDYTEELRRIDRPTLIIHGDDDQIVPIQASARRAVDIVPDATLKVYAGGSHGLAETDAERFNADVLTFIGA